MKDRRLLLLSLCGVRIVDPQLRELGVTLPGFVERGETIAALPSLSLLVLAAHSPEHWHCSYQEIDVLDDDLAATVAGQAFDLVAITALSARILEAYQLARELRRQGIFVVLGGLHVSALPDEARRFADVVVVGEGEGIWQTVLADFEAGQTRPIYRAPPHRFSADDPVPRYDLIDTTKYNRITLQTCRGCPLDCHFCAASRSISRFKSKPEALLRRELAQIVSHWPRPFIELADDNTFVHKTHGRCVVKLLTEHNLPWFTESDISLADDDALLELLAMSKCRQVLIGLESAIADSLSHVDRRQWKRKQFDSYRSKIEKIQATGVSVNGCFVLGFDHDTTEVFLRTKEFVEALELDEVQITLLTPFPGTALYADLAREHRLDPRPFWSQCTLFDLTFKPAAMSARELRCGFRWLMQQLYSPLAVERRRSRLRQRLRLRRAPSAEPK